MDRNLASALALASTAVLAVMLAAAAPDNAYADDITVDNTPFVSGRTRADVQSELFRRAPPPKTGAGEWALQSNPALARKTGLTKEQVQAEYKSSRNYASALLAEDSGSAYFMKSAPRGAGGTASMGGPAR
jgi:hypothetical protein